MDAKSPTGRRERKKAATRDRIIQVAKELFAEQGFLQTTILQITEKADVSERTFFRYFESKDDLLLLDLVAYFEFVVGTLAKRPDSERPLQALLASIEAGVRNDATSSREVPVFRPHRSEVDLTTQLAQSYLRFELRVADVLAERLVRDGLDDGSARFRGDVAAKVGVSTLRAAVREIFEECPDRLHPRADQLLGRIQRAFAIAVDEMEMLALHKETARP